MAVLATHKPEPDTPRKAQILQKSWRAFKKDTFLRVHPNWRDTSWNQYM